MPWSFVNGSDLTVLYNIDTGASIVLNQTFGLHFWFISGKGAKCKRISWTLDATHDSKPYRSSNLLCALQAGKGTKIDSRSEINGEEWNSEREGPIIALHSRASSGDRIYLTADGFIYTTTSNGAAIITKSFETCTSAERAKQALDIAIAQSTKTDKNLRIASLKVAMQTQRTLKGRSNKP